MDFFVIECRPFVVDLHEREVLTEGCRIPVAILRSLFLYYIACTISFGY